MEQGPNHDKSNCRHCRDVNCGMVFRSRIGVPAEHVSPRCRLTRNCGPASRLSPAPDRALPVACPGPRRGPRLSARRCHIAQAGGRVGVRTPDQPPFPRVGSPSLMASFVVDRCDACFREQSGIAAVLDRSFSPTSADGAGRARPQRSAIGFHNGDALARVDRLQGSDVVQSKRPDVAGTCEAYLTVL